MKSLTVFIGFLLLLPSPFLAQKGIALSSPDGHIRYVFRVNNDGIAYDISYKNRLIISNAGINLSFVETDIFKNNISVSKPIYREAVETYELALGKVKMVNDKYKEVLIPLREKRAPGRRMNLVVRAFNDGVAFRYEFPQQENWKNYSLTEENTTFRFMGDPKVLALLLPHFTTSHEGEYSSLRLSEVTEDTLIDMPALFELPNKTYVSITEAALLDYAGMYLSKHNGVLTSRLSGLAGSEIKVKAKLPHKSPWRVLMISDRIGTFIESNILTNLNEPSKIKDVSWIKPGKTTFPWWNGSIIPDTTFAPGNNFENNKYYIDFCARNNIEYHSVVESCGHEWYTNDGAGYQPGENVDVTRPVPGLNMQEICDYAKAKGVGIRVWVHWKALYPKIDTAFAIFEKWGISGMMVDFMDRDDQEMINIKEEILVKAAKHKLHIQFHGVEKPTGLSRTYPNEMTREGTLNYEVNKWDKRITPDHDLNIVFTRMLAGPTDYHMGGFRAVPDSLFKVQYTRPLMMGTRCHMLGMYVVLESYLGMACDYPAAYEGQPGFEFVKTVPTVWDETKVLSASVGEHIAIARRKDNYWYVGAINNHQERKLSLSLDFIDDGEYVAEIYTDAKDVSTNPDHLNKDIRIVTKKDKIEMLLAGGGGAAFYLRKK